MNNRYSIKIAGESGQGINVTGEILAKAIKNCGYYIFGYREYPSLIRGGHASYQIDVADKPINSPSKFTNILICFSRKSIHAYLDSVETNGLLLHSQKNLILSAEEKQFVEDNKISVEYLDALEISTQAGGNSLTVNILFTGIAWQILQYEKQQAIEVINETFASKPKYLEIDLKVFEAGYAYRLQTKENLQLPKLAEDANLLNHKIIGGNETLSLGAIQAGVRFLSAYPMTPSSSILTYLASVQHKTGMVIKQAEDEITAAQMALGAMHMGTRALTATSGGGFDLMTETISLAGMTEIPFVCVLAQRPGPATGLPTWTANGDLNLAIYSAHGEFPRCVLAASDAISANELIKQAYNIAEVFQIPVILLTEKQIAESLYQIDKLNDDVQILRGLIVDPQELSQLQASDRYKPNSNGVSARWIPGSSPAVFNANSDEHLEDGTVTEDSGPSALMMEKRMKKMDLLLEYLPEPTIYGPQTAKYSFVGWGSPKTTVLDVMHILNESKNLINYLHFEYIFPLKTEVFLDFVNNANNIILIENNYLGQLGTLLTAHTSYQFENKLLKYDGRPFFVEDIINYINNLEK